MTDPTDRPRPAYGEYSTPEEQRARMGLPDPVREPVVPAPAAPAPPAPAGPQPAAAAVGRPPADRIITLVLLAMGAINVLFSTAGLFGIGEAFARTYSSAGIPGEFTNVEAARTWGAVAAIALISGFLITALAAVRRLRAGRIAWWVAVVGAVITYVVIIACLMVPLAGDPAFQEYVRSMSAGG